MRRLIRKEALLAILMLGLIVPKLDSLAKISLNSSEQRRTLTFADRVAYQYAIEEVYWRHRIWPKENPGLKPSLDEVMPAAQIETKVEDYLGKSRLLADQWQRPITPDQLQSEMERMASHTKQPDVLRELFDALGNDPFVIAECLARPILAERLSVSSVVVAGVPPASENLFSADTAASTANRIAAATNRNNAPYTLPETSVPLDCTDDTWIGATPGVPDRRGYQTAVWTGTEMIIWGGDTAAFVPTGGRYNPSTDSWSATSTTNTPPGRKYHTAVWTGSEMIVWGGGSALNTGGRYNPSTDSWTPTSPASAPAGREYHTAVWSGSEMIIWGGYNGSYLNTGGRYNPSTDSWTATSTTFAPAGREYHTAVWSGSEMIVWGGFDGSSPGYLNTGGRYNPSTDSWTATSTTFAPAGREYHTAVWSGSEMIVWGGNIGVSPYYSNTGGRYNPSTDTWTPTSTNNTPTAREYHTAVWSGSEMIVWGGFDGSFPGYLNTGGRYNPSTNSWTATSTANVPLAREYHTAVWTGSEMIVWGGYNSGSRLNTGGRYNPSADSWTATSTFTLAGRVSHTAVWTGSEMIVWGGNTGISPYETNSGVRYNPSTDSWTATSTTNAPSARDSHTAIWTGAEMIVWGGFIGGFGYLNTGGRYNPGTDSWMPTNTTGTPIARREHTAVWTGSEMIVWGGINGGDLNTGGRYNPSTNSWIATSTTNVPHARSDHTAVWTGSQMIVWGGYYNLNTGGRYNPSADSWVATSITNAPAGRYAHTAVWTGSELIVWGGYDDDNSLNTGGRYNPGTDSWTATSTINAPNARSGHTAVWTGGEIIVWGGTIEFGGPFNTGGRYNPNTDSWAATSITNAPAGRYDHTAVWTGSQMIVWGGGYLNTGGRYCAQPSTPIVQSAVSRNTHGSAGSFDVDLPLSSTPGIECRTGGATNDYTMVITFLANVSVSGSPQATVASGLATIGSGGMSNGGTIITSGNVVTIPLTNVANAQTIGVTLNSVNGSTNVTIPMSVLVGDVSGNGAVNASDVSLTKSRVGQAIDATNFRSDVNINGSINATDVALVKSAVGTALP